MDTVTVTSTSLPAALNESLTAQLSNSAEDLLNKGLSVVVTTTSEAIFLLLVFVASAISNCLVFIIFYHRPHLRSLSNRFVLNLALCDLLYTVLVLPHAMACLLTGGLGAGLWWCRITKTLGALLALACSFAVLLIALDRYCAVMNPLHYGRTVTRGRSTLMIAGVWTAAFILAVLPFAVLGFTDPPSNRTSRANTNGCWTTATSLVSPPYRLWYALTVSSAGFLIPLALLLFVYSCMYRAARESSVRARRHSITHNQSDNDLPEMAAPGVPGSTSSGECTPVLCGNQAHHALVPAAPSSHQHPVMAAFRKSLPHGGASNGSNRRRSSVATNSNSSTFFREEGRAAQTGVLVVVSFVCCWFPFWAFVALEARSDWRPAPAQLGRTLAQHLTFLGCALNPFVYVYRNRMVWKDVRQAVYCRRRRMLQRRSCLPPKSPLASVHSTNGVIANGSASLPNGNSNHHVGGGSGGGGGSGRQNREIVWFRNGTIRQASRTLLKVALQEELSHPPSEESHLQSAVEGPETTAEPASDRGSVGNDSTTLLVAESQSGNVELELEEVQPKMATDAPDVTSVPVLSRGGSLVSINSQSPLYDRGDGKREMDELDDEVGDDVDGSDGDVDPPSKFCQSQSNTVLLDYVDNRNSDVGDDGYAGEDFGLPSRCHSDTWSTKWSAAGWSANKVKSAGNVINANHVNGNRHCHHRLALPLPVASTCSQQNNNNDVTSGSAPWTSCSLDYYCQYDNRSASAASVLRVTQSSQSYPGTTL